jgi:hypothetical protein
LMFLRTVVLAITISFTFLCVLMIALLGAGYFVR